VGLGDLLHHLSALTGLVACDVYEQDNGNTVYKGSTIYKGLHGWKLDKSIVELTNTDVSIQPYLDLRVIFKTVKGEDLDLAGDVETPPVRVVFASGGYIVCGDLGLPAVLPVLFLLHEANIDFELTQPRQDMVVLFQDLDFEVRGTQAILRYLVCKHKLTDWYPTQPELRANCDMALDYAQIQLQELVQTVLKTHLLTHSRYISALNLCSRVVRGSTTR
jgi:hypothetical protein